MVKVYAPNPDFGGEIAGVAFRRGVGEIDDDNAARIEYFRRKGYQVGEKKEGEPAGEESKSLDDMSRAELDSLAESEGIVGASSMPNKDEVREAIESARAEG